MYKFVHLIIISLFMVASYSVKAGFEKTPDGTWLSGWEKSELFSLDNKISRDGRFSLKYHNSNPGAYASTFSNIGLDQGKRYKISVWMQSRSLTGAGKGAGVRLDFFDKNGKHKGEVCLDGAGGTVSEWKQYELITGKVPDGTMSGKLSCTVPQGMTGTAWWSDLSVIEYQPSMLGAATTDCYRNETAGGSLLVRAEVNFDSGQGSYLPEKLKGELKVLDSSNKLIMTVPQRALNNDYVEFELDSNKLATGRYMLSCEVKVIGSSISDSSKCSFVKLAKQPSRMVYVDKYQRLIVNGKPFFPLGAYFSKVTDQDLRVYVKSGFNCVMPYCRPEQKEMDLLYKYGLKTFFNLKDMYYGTPWCPKDIQSRAGENEYIENKFGKFREHPALLAWYLNDELPASMVSRLNERQKFMEQFDPNHPTWTVLCRLDDVGAFIESYDAVGTDPYPIPYKHAGDTLRYTRETVREVCGLKPVWMVPQIFNWGRYAKNDADRKRTRPPTYSEMRSMSWQCIAGGANGLIFYSWFDVQRDKSAEFEPRRREIAKVVKEIDKYIPVLLSVETVPSVKFSGSSTVGWRAYCKNGAIFLLAVNSGKAGERVSFLFDQKITSCINELGKKNTEISSGTCSLYLEPLEPALLKIVITRP